MYSEHTTFVRAMPDEFKLDLTISSVEAYREYMHTKTYAEWRYSQKPNWWDEAKHEPVRQQYLSDRESKKLARKA